MAIIGVLIDNNFEDIEYISPVKAFKEADHSIVHVGLREGRPVKGKKKGTMVKIDKSFKDVSSQDFDAILIPGGCSPDNLRGEKEAVDFVKEYFDTEKPIFAICHAPQILITAQVLEGRRVAGWKSIVQDIINAGAEFVDEEVVEDGNIISSRGPRDVDAFSKACLKRLETIQKSK